MNCTLKTKHNFTCVCVKGHDSSDILTKYGVPQRSALKTSPLLFLIYINKLPNINQRVKFTLYVDDANIIMTGENMHEIEELLSTAQLVKMA